MSNSSKFARLGCALGALLLAASPTFGQGVTINQLSAGSALTGMELLPMYQGANPAVTTTPSAIATYILNHSSAQSANTIFSGPTSGSAAAPSFRALVGADLPAPAASTLGGIESITAVAHEWITYIDTSGVPHQAQPAFTDISGVAANAQIPAPTASALGGVESITSLPNNWIAYIDTSGVPHQSQPAIGNISGWGTNVATALGNALNGSGGLVGYSGNLGTPTAATLTNATGLPVSTGVSGLGTGVAAALGNAVNGSGGLVTFGSVGIQLGSVGATSVAAGTTDWLGQGIGVNVGVASAVAFGGTLQNMYVEVGTAPSSGTITATLYTASTYPGTGGSMSSTSMSCTITGSATSCSDTTHTVSISAGQVWAIQLAVGAGSSSTTGQTWALQLIP